MWPTLLRGLRPRRLVPTVMAVVLAVGFVGGTIIFGDTAKAAFVNEYAASARAVDVAVTAAPGTRLPLSTVDYLRRTEGVATTSGRMVESLPLLDRDGREVARFGETGSGINVGGVAALRGYGLTAGREPAAAGEAAIDTRAVEATGYGLGDRVTVLDRDRGRHDLTVVGIVDAGTGDGSGVSVVVLTEPELARLTGTSGYRDVVATTSAGVDPAVVRDRLARVRDRLAGQGGAVVRTGDELRQDLAGQAFSRIDSVILALTIFAWVAVLVAAFVIYNTFTILVAQRIRETALLRCVGASRRQVFGLVMAESLLVGLAGGAIGILAGAVVAWGLAEGSALLGLGLPSGGLVLTLPAVGLAIVLGLVVTVVSTLVPAIRATRTSPLAALRITPLARIPSRRGRVALLGAAAVTALGGTALTVAGLRVADAQLAMVLVAGGGVVNFLALLLVLPLIVGRVMAALAWLPGWLSGARRGAPVRLAAAQAHRNPGRTAATTAALLIGVGLMAGGSTIAATVDRTAEAELNEAFPVDYLLTPARLSGPPDQLIPAAVLAGLRADPAFALVAPLRQGPANVDGREEVVTGLAPGSVGDAYRPRTTDGQLSGFGPGAAIATVGDGPARHVGDRLELRANGGRVLVVTIVAVARSSSVGGDVIVTTDDFASLHPGVDGESLVLIRTAAGVSADAARGRLNAVLRGYPSVRVDDLAALREERTATIDQVVAVAAALLGFALVIALVGIANTLSLSVLERTRESALIRALGLTRGQLQGTLFVEAMLMAVTGALLGVAFGAGYGWLMAEAALGGIPPLVSIPVARLAGFVVLAALAGVMAAVGSARRAARVSLVVAMADG